MTAQILTKSRLLLALAVLSLPAFAQPAGVPNFHKVDDQVYRGAQPSTEGFQNLAKLGVKTVLDLREADSRSTAEKKVVEAAGMRYVNIPLRGMAAPSAQDVAKILGHFADTKSGPVFVHCRRGADRTGTVIACLSDLPRPLGQQESPCGGQAEWHELGRARHATLRAGIHGSCAGRCGRSPCCSLELTRDSRRPIFSIYRNKTTGALCRCSRYREASLLRSTSFLPVPPSSLFHSPRFLRSLP